jgi:ComF family protein
MGILDLIFPKECLQCKKRGKYICRTCVGKLPFVKQICPVCKKPSIDGFTHPKCIKPQSLDGLTALWPHKGVIRKSIISLKYKYVKEISSELSSLVLQRTGDLFFLKRSKCVLTTVPIFWIRKNIRGYNQVDGITKSLADKFSLEFYPNLLRRKKYKDPQVTLKKEERTKNVQGVFSLNPKYKSQVANYKILIVDDVYTTGSTLKEMGKVLKRNRVKEVWGLVIAK